MQLFVKNVEATSNQQLPLAVHQCHKIFLFYHSSATMAKKLDAVWFCPRRMEIGWLNDPFEGCFSFVKDITDFLEKLITWPRDCGRAIGDCATRCPNPF
eukprot:scaffold21257_cov144-Skeletonema_marinoi.AAC.2